MSSVAERRQSFRRLHDGGCFIIPNPWDVGTTKYLSSVGFKALATTSAGAAFSMGRPDYGLTAQDVISHVKMIVDATDLPVNADFENGLAMDEKGLADNVRRCIETGVAGFSIEDSTGDKANPLFELDRALARMRVTRATVDAVDRGTFLVARSEAFLVGHPEPLKEATKRLVAFAEAGADCLYAPGVRKREDIEAIVKAVAPKPFNLLVAWPIGFTLAQIADMGVRRVSVGGALANAAWGGLQRATAALKEGRFDAFADNAKGAELGALFARMS